MTSVGIQADPNDPEGVLGIVRSFQSQLQDLVQISTTLTELNTTRGQSIQECESRSENLDGKIQDLVASAGHMESILRENQHRQEDGDKELGDLTNRNEHLESEIRRLQGNIGETTNGDVDAEIRLAGFDVEDLYRKMDDLSFLHQRLDRANKNLHREWNEFKEDIRHSQDSMQPFLEAKNHLDELTLARYLGMQSRKDDKSELELAERLCNYHENRKLHAQLEQQMMESEMRSRDLDHEIGTLLAEKRDLWRRCLDLENFLNGISGDTDRHLLRPAHGHADITEVVEGRSCEHEYSDDDLEVDLDVEHGMLLHRCPKMINIAIDYDDCDIDDDIDDGVFVDDAIEQGADVTETSVTEPTHITESIGNVAELFHQEEDDLNTDESDQKKYVIRLDDVKIVEADDADIGTSQESDVTAATAASINGSDVQSTISAASAADNNLNVLEDCVDPESTISSLSMEAREETRYVGGHHEQPTSIMMKFRRRLGLRDVTSSSVKIRSEEKKVLSTTSSLRGLAKTKIFRRKR